MYEMASLAVLLAVVGIAFADTWPGRRLSRPMVNLQQASLDELGFLGTWVRVM
jgi:hypothetical protein